jgi:CheY-like chemotaxis protein
VDLLRATLPAKIEIRKRFAGDLPPVRADATQLHQVIMNLGANAAHAMTERGGVLEVAIEAVNLAAAALPAAPAMPPGRYLRLAVSDTGCGMDQATLERVFEPFFTTKPRGEGVGLGLSVVHGIMQGHEGAIDVASALGEGTVVNMYFPAVEVEGSALAPAAAAAETRGHGERVLYVDDEEALVYLADRTLTRLGYRVAGFTDPRQALQAFRARPEEFDAVVTDVSMPGMSGPELARELLQIRPGVPIVITSGFVRPEDVAAAKQLGIRDLILKPNTVEELGRVLDATLRAPARSENPV